MSRYSSDSGGGDFKQPAPGNHLARAVEIIDLGTQHSEWQGDPIVRPQIIIRWELPMETVEVDGVDKPMLASKFYTNSLGEKANLRRDLESWRSRPFTSEELRKFDLQTILGAPCMLSIVHNEKGKAVVKMVAALPKGMVCPPAFNEFKAFWLDVWDDAAFEALPEGFKRIIRESDEYTAMMNPHRSDADNGSDKLSPPGAPADFDDSIPF